MKNTSRLRRTYVVVLALGGVFLLMPTPVFAADAADTTAAAAYGADAVDDVTKSMQMLASIYRAAPAGIGMVENRVFVSVNDYIVDLTGYSKAELLGRNSRMLALLQLVLIIILLRNLSARKRAVQELRASEQYLAATLRSIGDGVITCDADGAVVSLNAVAEKLTGWQTAEAAGHVIEQVFRIVNSYTGLTAENPVGRALRDGVVVGLANHTLLLARDGEEYQIADSCAPIIKHNGAIIGAVLVFRDVTEEYHRREQLRESEERYRLLTVNAVSAIAVHELIFDAADQAVDYRFLAVNPAFELMTGLSAQQVVGKTVMEVMPETEKYWIETYARVVQTGESTIFENYSSALDKHYQISAYCSAPNQFACIFIDVSDFKRSQQVQRRMRILESLGTVAGGIAHDFNNLLVGVFGNIELAQADLAADHPACACLTTAHQALEKARRLSTRLLTFAKGGNPVFERVDLRQEICENVQFHLVGSNVAAKFTLAADLWPAKGDKGQIGEVIANLTVNAREAMPNGGTLYVQADNIAQINPATAPQLSGDYVHLSFRDQGCGIDPDVIDKIFDPYFTTKATGSGLGLAIIHGIVSKHNGHITVDSVPGQGTTFEILLPRDTAAAPAEVAEPQVTPPTMAPASGRILVMDDEELIRAIASRMLKRLGYSVETATDGRDALAKYVAALQHGKSFDVVIMDLTIPGGMGGKQAVQELLNIDPAARAVVFSGYSSDLIVADYAKYGFCGCLAKPFQLQELAMVLRSAISSCAAEPPLVGENLGRDMA